MAGRRQHYVPQFLQRGFCIDSDVNSSQCWVFRYEKEPFRCSTKNVGVSKDFYSTQDDTALDDLITEKEQTEYSRIIASYYLYFYLESF